MKYIESNYFVNGISVVLYRDVIINDNANLNDNIELEDVLSGEKIIVSKKWKEYIPSETDLPISYHKSKKFSLHTGFRQFKGKYDIFHQDCELVCNHGHSKNLVVVRCVNCGCEMQQGINSGECVSQNFQPMKLNCRKCVP